VALDVRLDDGPRVHVHHGTRETPARVAWLGGRFHQLRCEAPLVARAGDRLVIRQIAPPDTLGGGVVLDPSARKHGPSRDLTTRLERALRGEREPSAEGGDPRNLPHAKLERVTPLSPAAIELAERLRAAGLDAPNIGDVDPSLLAELRTHGRAERVGRVAMHHDTLAAVEQTVRNLIARDGAVTLAALRDELQTSRKYAQALLEHLDAKRVTRRLPDDSRVLSRRASG
jgi:selenocysteine-specific elongation factor